MHRIVTATAAVTPSSSIIVQLTPTAIETCDEVVCWEYDHKIIMLNA